MFSALRTVALVTLCAVVLWVFAESESLGEFSGLTTLRFSESGGESADRLVQADESFDGTITVDFVGSKAGISRCEAELTRGVVLTPGMSGVPAADGRHTINLLRALQDYAPMKQTGVRLVSVTPQAVEIEVREIVTVQAPIEPVLEGVRVVGEIALTPDRVAVRLPRAAAGGDVVRVQARLDPSQASRLPSSGPVRAELQLIPPARWAALAGFSMERATTNAEFTIGGLSVSESLRSVPVQLVLPPVEIGKWEVSIVPEDRFLAAEVSGPAEAIERLRSGSEAMIAVISISSDELRAKIPAKQATFMVLRGGLLLARPELQVQAARSEVRLVIAERSEAGPSP